MSFADAGQLTRPIPCHDPVFGPALVTSFTDFHVKVLTFLACLKRKLIECSTGDAAGGEQREVACLCWGGEGGGEGSVMSIVKENPQDAEDSHKVR